MSLIRSGQSLDDFLSSFWTSHLHQIENEDTDFKKHELPLARIKKVMKSDPSVKMISGEAPILFSKACEIFISELTCRAWLVAEANKRRTLQRADVAGAVELSDQFDFLIDIIPRGEESKKRSKSKAHAETEEGGDNVENEQEQAQQEVPQEPEAKQEEEQQHGTEQQVYNSDPGDPLSQYTTHNSTDADNYLPYDPDFLLSMIDSSPNAAANQASGVSGTDDAN
ncbi:hypothetical protein E3P99_03174 [Wallemia hederae]|uniref:Transcription factor CBF/NF-Y/archaeal histone domain-containing protein n=1 Tax=Wallemia hederae TaxID=1540922 RepID=A0A4T0FHN4_9BASI|nr:hypothetical protein E3P99_03174 [Wallemia hederae]